MKPIFYTVFSLLLISSTCKKEEECHTEIQFINQSSDEVIFALRFTDADGNCTLDGNLVSQDEAFNWRPYNSCIEDQLTGSTSLEIYIVDNDQYNTPGVFYNCDSLGDYNEILQQYSLTLDALRQNNFMVTYP